MTRIARTAIIRASKESVVAGTGHPYEIVNYRQLRDTLEAYGSRVPDAACRAWFVSKPIIRHFSGAAYVVRVHDKEAIDNIVASTDGQEAEILLRKLAAGADLRMFVPTFAGLLDPDMPLIADWLAALPQDDPRMVGKLARVTLGAARKFSNRWHLRQTFPPTTSHLEGNEQVFLRIADWQWVELLDEAALRREGDRMHHCVSEYGERLRNGSRIFSLRSMSGGPALTAEFIRFPVGPTAAGQHPATSPPDAGYGISQIRGPNNARPRPGHARMIAAIMNRLDVRDGRHGQSADCWVARNTKGEWCPLQEFAERIVLFGKEAIGHDNLVHVMSRASPGTILATIAGGGAGWWMNEDPGQYLSLLANFIVDIAPMGHAGASTQREIAELLNLVGSNAVVTNMPTVVDNRIAAAIAPGGDRSQWLAFVDFCERIELGGVTCLKVGQEILVTEREDLDRVIAWLSEEPQDYGKPLMTVSSYPQRHISREGLDRIIAVMSAARVVSINRNSCLARMDIWALADGRWIDFTVGSHETVLDTPHGPTTVLINPAGAARISEHGLSASPLIYDTASRTVAYQPWLTDRIEAIECLTALFNHLDVVPPREGLGPMDWGDPRCNKRKGIIWDERHHSKRYHPVYDGKRWQVVDAEAARDDFESKLPKTGHCTSVAVAACHFLVPSRDGSDPLDYCRHLACALAKELLPRWLSADVFLEAAPGIHGLTKKDRNLVARAVTAWMKAYVPLSRRKLAYWQSDDAARVGLAYMEFLNKRALRRFSRVLKGSMWQLMHSNDTTDLTVNPCWIDLAKRFRDKPDQLRIARSILLEALDRKISRLRWPGDRPVLPFDVETANNWLDCLDCLGSEWEARSAIGKLTEIVPDNSPQWADTMSRLTAIKEREAKARQSRWPAFLPAANRPDPETCLLQAA